MENSHKNKTSTAEQDCTIQQPEEPQIDKQFLRLIEKFCDALKVEKNASKHTIRNYRTDLIAFGMWAYRLGQDPQVIKYRQLRGYLAEMDSAGYSRTTINRRLSSLRSFFKWCDITGNANNNSADVMQGPKLLKTLPPIARSNDIDKLFKTCAGDIANAKNSDLPTQKKQQKLAQAKRDYAIVELMYATGARISEIAELQLNNINFSQGIVKFLGKGNKERRVPLHKLAIQALKNYIDDYRPILFAAGRNNQTIQNVADYAFISNTGKIYSADSIRLMFRKKCNAAGVSSNIHPHSMRHTFATDVLDGGADLRTVQEMLGHSSLSTTQIYTHLSTKKLSDVHTQAHPRG